MHILLYRFLSTFTNQIRHLGLFLCRASTEGNFRCTHIYLFISLSFIHILNSEVPKMGSRAFLFLFYLSR